MITGSYPLDVNRFRINTRNIYKAALQMLAYVGETDLINVDIMTWEILLSI